MNFGRRIRRLSEQMTSLEVDIASLRNKFESATEFTGKFLDECAKAGLTKVAIAAKHKSIPESTRFPFDVEGSVFAIGPKSSGGGRDRTGFPAIWGVVERMDIHAGCGNGMQVQADTSNLIDGVYHLRGGAWKRLEEGR